MGLNRHTLIGSASTLLAGVAISFNAAAAEWVVLESNAPTYAAGELLTSSSSINLSSDHRMTLLSSGGESRSLNGPLKKSMAEIEKSGGDAEASKIALALDRLISPRKLDDTQTGTIRSSDAAQLDDSTALNRENRTKLALLPWEAMTSQVIALPGSTQCVRKGTPLTLRRLESAKGSVRIKKAGGEPVQLDWADRQEEQPWPSEVPIQDSAIYLISQPSRMVPADVLLRLVPESLSEAKPQFQIARLAGMGCMVQARLLNQQSQPPKSASGG